MNNTLLIHIGMPKTGTSTLQKFLLTNKDKIEEYGWCYPILNDDEIGIQERGMIESCGNGYYIFEALVLNNIKSEWDKGMKVALKHLKDKNVIISSEHVYSNGTDKFIASAKESCENIKVVIYLRRQDRAIESLYNQLVKNGDEYKTFEKFIDSDAISKNHLEYVLKLDSISQIIGKENLIVRIYEKQQLIRNDIVTDFLSILGIPSDREGWEKSEPINFSLGGNYLEINRLMNSVQNVDGILGKEDDIWSDGNTRHDFCGVCTALSRSFNQDKGEHGFFSPDERKEFLERFALENEQIAREYMHRDDGILFYDDRMDYPIYAVNQYSSFESDIIRVFTAMLYVQNRRLYLQNQRLMQLEKKSGEIIGKLLMKDISQKSRDRKLLLFGAGCNCRKLFDIVGNISATMIADNDLTKHCTVVNGVQVRYAKNIVDWQEYFIIVTCEKTDEIEEQLYDLGLKKEEDYILMREYGL